MDVKNPKSFTLMELIVAALIASVLAVIALSSFSKMVKVADVEEAMRELKILYGANQAFRARNWIYWPNDGADHTYVDINTAFELNLNDETYNFTCLGNIGGTTWRCRADSTPKYGSSDRFIVEITQDILSNTNPQCLTGMGNCP